MPVSHARVTALTSTDEKVPGLLGVLAQVGIRARCVAGGSAWCSRWPWR